MNTQLSYDEFLKQAQWSPNGGLDSWENYSGPDLSAWLKGPGRGRDSDHMAESNFEAALEMLGGEREGIVEVHRFGHWACGWFEHILVNPANKKAAKVLYEIYQALERYSLLDESDYSERQYEAMSDYADGTKHELVEALCIHLGLPEELHENEDMLQVAYDLNMECQMYYGDDCCINVYKFREPDFSDWGRVENCLGQMYHAPGENAAFDLLKACFGMSKDEEGVV